MPNVQHLAEAPFRPVGQIWSQEPKTKNLSLLKVNLRDTYHFEMDFQINRNLPIIGAMRVFAAQAQRDFKQCRFRDAGNRLSGQETLQEVRLSRISFLTIANDV